MISKCLTSQEMMTFVSFHIKCVAVYIENKVRQPTASSRNDSSCVYDFVQSSNFHTRPGGLVFSGASSICKRGVKVERRRREYRGAEGAEGFFDFIDLKMSTSSAF